MSSINLNLIFVIIQLLEPRTSVLVSWPQPLSLLLLRRNHRAWDRMWWMHRGEEAGATGQRGRREAGRENPKVRKVRGRQGTGWKPRLFAALPSGCGRAGARRPGGRARRPVRCPLPPGHGPGRRAPPRRGPGGGGLERRSRRRTRRRERGRRAPRLLRAGAGWPGRGEVRPRVGRSGGEAARAPGGRAGSRKAAVWPR